MAMLLGRQGGGGVRITIGGGAQGVTASREDMPTGVSSQSVIRFDQDSI